MSREKEVRWLYDELPLLVRQGILSEDTASKLKNYYGPLSKKKGPGLIFIITGVLGAVLIGAGIILLFAHNWESLSRTWRAVFSFLPLTTAQLIYGYVYFKKREVAAWVESSCAFLMLMLASSIALISQTYNIGGTLEDFILTCMVLSIPLLYLTNSSLACVMYLAGISYWVVEAGAPDSNWYLLLLAAAIPHLVLNIRPEVSTIRGNILGWATAISLFIACFRMEGRWTSEFVVYAHGLVFVLLYLIGKLIYAKGTNIWSRPFQTSALLLIFTYSLFFSFEWPLRYFDNLFTSATIQFTSSLLVLGIGILGLYNFKKRSGMNYLVLIYPLLLLIPGLLGNEKEGIPVLFFNIYILVFGVHYIHWGIKTGQISFVNAGMFLVSALLVVRFFDQDITFVVKGLAFILIGLCFLVVNLVLSKKIKAKHEKESR